MKNPLKTSKQKSETCTNFGNRILQCAASPWAPGWPYASPSRTGRGFSLVEVTIALGIVGFAAVTVMALVPVGLKSLRNSIDQTVVSQIGQQISSDILQTPFSQAEGFTNYYDNEGFPVSGVNDAVFTAAVTPSATFSYPGSDLLGGLTIPLTQSLKAFQVTVTTRETKNLSERYQHSFCLLLSRREQLTNL